MKKIIIVTFLFFILFIPLVHSENIDPNLSREAYLESIKEFAQSYPIEYNKIIELSYFIGEDYKKYKIGTHNAFFLYNEGPFNIEITIFNDGIVLNYIPEKYGISDNKQSTLWKLDQSYETIVELQPSYGSLSSTPWMLSSTTYGLRIRNARYGKEKLLETFILYPNNKINTKPKSFASKIAESSFENDLNLLMQDKLGKICDRSQKIIYQKISDDCNAITHKIVANQDYTINEFESNLLYLNEKIQPYRIENYYAGILFLIISLLIFIMDKIEDHVEKKYEKFVKALKQYGGSIFEIFGVLYLGTIAPKNRVSMGFALVCFVISLLFLCWFFGILHKKDTL